VQVHEARILILIQYTLIPQVTRLVSAYDVGPHLFLDNMHYVPTVQYLMQAVEAALPPMMAPRQDG